MTYEEAVAKAKARASRTGLTYFVTERIDHPAYPGETVYLVIAEQDKRLWAFDERCIEVIEGNLINEPCRTCSGGMVVPDVDNPVVGNPCPTCVVAQGEKHEADASDERQP